MTLALLVPEIQRGGGGPGKPPPPHLYFGKKKKSQKEEKRQGTEASRQALLAQGLHPPLWKSTVQEIILTVSAPSLTHGNHLAAAVSLLQE